MGIHIFNVHIFKEIHTIYNTCIANLSIYSCSLIEMIASE